MYGLYHTRLYAFLPGGAAANEEFQDLLRGRLNYWKEDDKTGSLRIFIRPCRLRNMLDHVLTKGQIDFFIQVTLIP